MRVTILLKMIGKKRMLVICLLLIIASLPNVLFSEITREIFHMIDIHNFSDIGRIILFITMGLPLIYIGQYLYLKVINLTIARVNVCLKNKLLHSFMKGNEDILNNDGSSVAKTIAIFTNDLKLLEDNLEKIFFDTLMYGLMFLFASIYALLVNPIMGSIFIAFSLFSVFIPKIFGGNISSASHNWSLRNRFFIDSLQDILNGRSTIKGYGIEEIIINRVKNRNVEMEQANAYMNNQVAKSNMVLQCMARFTFILPMLVGIYFIIHGHLTIGALMALAQVSNSIGSGFVSVLTNWNLMLTTKPIYMKIAKRLKQDEHKINLNHELELVDKIVPIEVKHITVQTDQHQILKDVSFKIDTGQKLLIMGPSGSGKTTLLKALQGSVPLSSGQVMSNGQDLNKISNYIKHINMITQEPFMFHDSILFNITFGESFSEIAIQSACDLAGLTNLIIEKGLNTNVGENGRNLSGGQQQRLEIARAILHHKELLLVDEATSALDAKNSEVVRHTFLQLPQAVIEIAHHINKKDMVNYDQLIILINGRITEQGSYKELKANPNSYVNQF